MSLRLLPPRTMTQLPRLNYPAAAPKSLQGLLVFATRAAPGLGLRLKELVNLRISQINGCALCMDIHSAALTKDNVDPRRLHLVAGWREAHDFFDARERAALSWAEAVNAIPHHCPTNEEFARLLEHFSEAEAAELTFEVCVIRAMNMLNVSFRLPLPEKPYDGEELRASMGGGS